MFSDISYIHLLTRNNYGIWKENNQNLEDSKVGTLDKGIKVELFMTSTLLKIKHVIIDLAGPNNIHFMSNTFLSFKKMALVVCILNKGLVSHALENSNGIHFAPYNNYCRLYNLVVLFGYSLEIRKGSDKNGM